MSTVELFILIAVAAFVALLLARLIGAPARPLDLHNPKDQLIAVRRAEFSVRPIMNGAEFKRFAWLETWASDAGLRLFTQVSYGEIIRSQDREAHASINSKRADFVLVDSKGLPAAVVEYQGSGHYRGNAAARDKVKRAALERAGIPFIEVFPNDDRATVIAKVDAALR